MLQHLPNHLPPWFRSPRDISIICFCAVVVAVSTYFMTRKRVTAEERERARRDQLARNGRITDGSITETQWVPDLPDDSPGEPTTSAADTPTLLIYRYEIAGVTYECAQDVTRLSDLVCQIRVDLPVQVRFDPRNPGNSIVVAETWNGLRLASNQPLKPTLGTPTLTSQSEPS